MLTEFVWVTGLVKLLTDASLALYIVLPLLALIVIGWNVVKRLQADDHEKIKYKENMKTTLVYLVIGMTVNGFITMLLSYFPSS
ncbi:MULTISPECIES: hypothetical protein [Acetobacterium]|uniref:Uncharacterized protein n=1 Tax=Acetobacterium malicum TaxID=52692 RepID=A0ABR6YXC4_9FIRM|nr:MULTISPECIES: hypothetical protein [Acetobacterium]MBC3899729.1 hypothetical protein [Acetobacterium malicum]MDD3307497.1 hypothetical protein [Acetobacterium sp.]PKM59524.1 MAG: hypothetical protein CVU99_13000 [Firmicutes bacterium HGW-Firmicutes-4]